MPPLETVSADDLRDVLAAVEGKDPTKRVMVALNYKEEDGVTQAELADRYGMSTGWVSRWVRRLERLDGEPYEDVVYDDSRPGRPAELAGDDHDHLVEVLQQSPAAVGFDAPAWSVPLCREFLNEAFGVEYCDRHVRRLMSDAGLSPVTTQSAPCRDQSDPPATVWTTNS